MNRADFMRKLANLLADVSPAEREEAIQYYNDYFDDAGAENEQSVIASLGSPEQLARTIKAGLSDGGNMGEFTEKGFSGYETGKSNEVLDPNQDNADGKAKEQNFGRDTTSNANGRPNSNNAYGYRRENYNNSSYGNGSYNNTYSGSGSYQNAYGNAGSAVQKETKKQMSGGMIALIIILCVFASPFLLGIGGGIIGLLGGLLGCVVGFGVAMVALIIAGVCLFVYGIGLLFSIPLGGLCTMGGGMICLAIGLFFLWLVVLICGLAIPAIVRGISKLFQSIFHRGGKEA